MQDPLPSMSTAVRAVSLSPERLRPGPLFVACLGIGLGVLLFLGLGMKWPTAHGGPLGSALLSEPSWWVADRDASQLVGLDDDLFLQKKLAQRHPVKIATAADGHWFAAAVGGHPLGRHALFFQPAGAAPGVLPTVVPGGADLGPLLDLEATASGGVLWVEFGLAGSASRVLRMVGASVGVVPPSLPTLEVFVEHPGATAALGVLSRTSGAGGAATTGALSGTTSGTTSGTVLGEDVLVGDAQGKLTRYSPHGRVLGVASIGGEVGDLQPGPGGRILALDVTGPGRIVCLDADLLELWSIPASLASESLSVVPGQERFWIADSSEPLARRYGPGGALELEVLLPGSDVSAVLAGPDGGALFTTPGAVLRVDPFGAILPGQGGFAYLTDIAPGV